MKSCVLNALEIVIVDFFKKKLLNIGCLKSVTGHSLTRPYIVSYIVSPL